MTLYPLHILLLGHASLQWGYYILHLWCFSCSTCEAWLHNCDDGEKTALAYHTGSFTAGQCHCSFNCRWYTKSYNTGQQKGRYIYTSPVSGLRFCRRCPFLCQYQQKCQQRVSVSTLCQIITGSGAQWVHNAPLNPSLGIKSAGNILR